MESTVTCRMLASGDHALLDKIAPGVFDNRIVLRLTAEFLADPRHHLAVALDGGSIVGMASGVHYIHPDKPAELWINEVGVAPTHRRRGIAAELLRTLFRHACALGCREAWVLTEPENRAARKLYASAGGHESKAVCVTFDLGGAGNLQEATSR